MGNGAPPPVAPSGGGALDVLSKNAAENARRAQARDLGTSVVTALFRLVKLSTLHSLDNQAMIRQVDETVQLVGEYGQRTEHNVSILFAKGSVFIGGQLLRANRGVYEGALELGEILSKVGAAEIGIMRDAKASDFIAFASALADSLRSSKPTKVDRPSPRIRLRGINASALLRENVMSERVDPSTQVARTYASAVVIMRRFFEDVKKGRYDLPQRVKRVAQRLVDLSTGETPAFLGVTAARNQNHDEAGRAVNTAILALAMTRQISNDMVQLARLAMSALLFETARPRLAGITGSGGMGGIGGVIPTLSEQQDNDFPAASAVVLTALGRINEPSVMRTVISYEAHWEKRRARLGALYRGLRAPSLQARILSVARSFNDMLTPAPGLEPPTADEAIARLEQEATDPADRTVLRLLIGALGVFTTGTIVKLSTGETALVVQAQSHPSLYSQPRVRMVLDGNGGWLQPPIEIDLAHQRRGRGENPKHITEVVATSNDPAGAQLRAWAAGQAASGVRQQQANYAAQSMLQSPPSQIQNPPSYQQNPPSYQQNPPSYQNNPPSYQNNPPSYQQNPPSYQHSSPSHQHSSPSYQQGPSSAPSQQQSSPSYGQTPQPGSARRVRKEPSPPPPPPQDELQVVEEEEQDNGASTRAVSWEEQSKLIAPTRAAQASLPPPAPEPAPVPEGPLVPSAEGTLQKTPFVHLLIYMLDQRLSGTTVFSLPDGVEHQVYFQDGVPAKVKTGTMIEPLDRTLVALGMLDEATLRTSLMEVSKKQVLHGRHLVMKGLLTREQVMQALRAQVLRKVTHLFELPAETQYAYYDGHNLIASYGGPELTAPEPLATIMAGIRLMAGSPLIEHTLARLANRPLALHVEAEMKKFQLERDEAAVVDLIRARRTTIAELMAAGVAQERVLRLMVYALAITRHLDLGGPGKPPVGKGGPEPVVAQPTETPPPAAQRGRTVSGPEQRAAAAAAIAAQQAPAQGGGRRATGVTEVPAGFGQAPPAAQPGGPRRNTGVTEVPAGFGAPQQQGGRRTTGSVEVPPGFGAPQQQGGRRTTGSVEVPPGFAGPASQPPQQPMPQPGRRATGVTQVPAGFGASPQPPSVAPPAGGPRRSTITQAVPPGFGATPPGQPGYPPAAPQQPQYGSPQQPPPQYGSPQQPPPQYGAPQQQQPQYGSPQQPQYGSPQQPPQYGSPQPQYGSPQQPPQYGAPPQPQYGSPQQPPQYGSPQQPQYGAPQQQPQYGAPQPPQYGAPQQQPQYGAPQQQQPQYGAPQASYGAQQPSPYASDPYGGAPQYAPQAPSPSQGPSFELAGGPPSTRAPAPPSTRAPAPVAERPEITARRAEIQKRAATIDSEDYYQMLGVAVEATPDQVKAAYFQLAKAWHPDRLPQELQDVKIPVARVFARFSEAYQTLMDPAKSKDYAALKKQGGGSPEDAEKVARVVDAALEFQKAEILLKKNDLATAEQLAARAVQADPEQPEYLALLVWVQAQRRGDPPGLKEGMTSSHFDDLIKLLDSVLQKEPKFERALYYRGVLLKRSGKLDKAIRDFRQAAELNPKNLDAVREVRLFEMRKRGGGAAPPPSGKGKPAEDPGLFGKLFKK